MRTTTFTCPVCGEDLDFIDGRWDDTLTPATAGYLAPRTWHPARLVCQTEIEGTFSTVLEAAAMWGAGINITGHDDRGAMLARASCPFVAEVDGFEISLVTGFVLLNAIDAGGLEHTVIGHTPGITWHTHVEK